MLEALFTGIYARYNDSSVESVALRASLTNGLHHPDAPQSTDYPFARVWLVSAIPANQFEETKEEALIQFDIFSSQETSTNPIDEIYDLYDKLDAVYEKCSLTITGYTLVYMKREFIEVLPPEEGIHQVSIQYRILMELD